MLVTTNEMFKKAYEGKYAIGAFNVNNMEIVQWIMSASVEKNTAVILQVSAGARKYANSIYLKHLVEAASELNPEIPVALHLDHWSDFEICKQCVDSWFTSVMIDWSHHDFEWNIEVTKKVVEYAHAHWVVVEAELWKLEWVEDDVIVEAWQGSYTDPDQAVEFVQRTWVDSLAIAIWTSHWAYKFSWEPKLDFERLEKISQLLPEFPLVLHWSSTVVPEFVDLCNQFGGNIPWTRWVPEEMISQASKFGVCKINIDTDIRLAMTGIIRQFLAENPSDFDPRKYLAPAREAVRNMVSRKIDFLWSENSITN